MIVYKVARPTNNPGVYTSIAVGGKAEVTYTLNKRAYAPRWLARKGNYLCAFYSLHMARDFAILCFHKSYAILKCEAGTICKKLGLTCSIYHLKRGERILWHEEDWQKGTIMVKTLVPVREVERLKAKLEINGKNN